EPAPLDREAVGVGAERLHERDVLGHAVPVVDREPAPLAPCDLAGLLLPARPVVPGVAALDLVRGGRRAPEEAGREADGARDLVGAKDHDGLRPQEVEARGRVAGAEDEHDRERAPAEAPHPQRPFSTARRARKSTSPGKIGRTSRPSLPFQVMTSTRWRASIAPTLRAAHSSAVMIRSSCMGLVPSGCPSTPAARRWISERTK